MRPVASMETMSLRCRVTRARQRMLQTTVTTSMSLAALMATMYRQHKDIPGPAFLRLPNLATKRPSLNCHALGQVARFIYVASKFDGQMISEKLKGNNRENGPDRIMRRRNLDDVVGNVFQLFAAVSAGQRDDRTLARFHLLNVIEVF